MLTDQTLQLFEPISLDTLNSRAPLRNRVDRKFAFPFSQLQKVLEDCSTAYQVLNISNDLIFNYKNWYYDTEDLQFYCQHHNGKGNRCKVRKRLYENSGLHFIEVKQRNNKGNTIKYRCQADDISAADTFVLQYSGYNSAALRNTITINYSRITLLHKEKIEKVTFDMQVTCRHNESIRVYNDLVIAEVKTERSNAVSFCEIMKRHAIHEGSLSKYCLGMISLDEHIRQNNFKEQYNRILKINKNGNA